MREKILITRQWPDAVMQAMSQKYDVAADPTDRPLSQAELAQAMREFDAICPTITDRLEADMITQPDRQVRLIANYGAGYEHIDLAAAKAAAVVVTNTPDVLTESTAELTILLIMMTARRVGEGERQLRAGNWQGWHPVHLLGKRLHGARLGLVGYGRIAQATARLAQDLWGMPISYHARRQVPSGPDVPQAQYFDTLSELLADSDIVSVQCPGGSATYHMLNAATFAQFKPGALLINTARGSIIDEAALAQALRKGIVGGAGLDVYEAEPAVNPDLLDLENVVLLPHLGSATLETRTAMGLRVMANVDAFFAGQELPDRVA